MLHGVRTDMAKVTFLSLSVTFLCYAYGTYSELLTDRVSGKVKPTTRGGKCTEFNGISVFLIG